MSNTYRGYALPEVIHEGSFYYIADPEVGWFESGDKDIAFLHWQNKVDTIITRQYIQDGLFSIWGEHWMCVRCGSLVLDVFKHVDFHSGS